MQLCAVFVYLCAFVLRICVQWSICVFVCSGGEAKDRISERRFLPASRQCEPIFGGLPLQLVPYKTLQNPVLRNPTLKTQQNQAVEDLQNEALQNPDWHSLVPG